MHLKEYGRKRSCLNLQCSLPGKAEKTRKCLLYSLSRQIFGVSTHISEYYTRGFTAWINFIAMIQIKRLYNIFFYLSRTLWNLKATRLITYHKIQRSKWALYCRLNGALWLESKYTAKKQWPQLWQEKNVYLNFFWMQRDKIIINGKGC